MGNLISYSKSHKSNHRGLQVTDTDKAILDLRIARKQLVEYKRQQEQLVERSQQAVSELLGSKKRDRALIALKKKKLHEKQAMQLETNILRLDEQVVALETTAQQVDTVSALRTANQAMKAMQQQIPLDAVEKLLQENAEAAEYVDEVNSLLGNRLGDVEGLDDELAALEKEVVQEQAAEMPEVPQKRAEAVTSATAPDTATGEPGSTQEDLPAAPTHAAIVEEADVAVESQEAELVPA